MSLSLNDFLSLHDYDTHTNTQENVESSDGEFMDQEEKERDKDAVSEEHILSQVGPFQVPQTHKIVPLSMLGCDQQNLEKILSGFK